MRFKDTLKHKYKHEENPQVRKTGVDAVHGRCAQRSNMWKIIICNMCVDDWNKDHRWGQKDVLLRRANIKEKYIVNNICYLTINCNGKQTPLNKFIAFTLDKHDADDSLLCILDSTQKQQKIFYLLK